MRLSQAISLVKALDILNFLTGHPDGSRLKELVTASGLPRPTVVRILHTLVA